MRMADGRDLRGVLVLIVDHVSKKCYIRTMNVVSKGSK
jgi:hypothetical protein